MPSEFDKNVLSRLLRRGWSPALVLVCALLAYSDSPRNGFTWDDHIYVEDNAFVRDPRNLRLLLDPRFYLEPRNVLAGSRPVFLGSLAVDRALWGDKAGGYHLTNVLLHAANSLWVYRLAYALCGPVQGAALLSGLLFALHPVQSEAVNAITFRADLLAAFFTFAALAAFLAARRASRTGFLLRLAACGACAALGLLSKESAAALPLLLLLVELYIPSRGWTALRLAAAALVLAAVLAPYAVFRSARPGYAAMRAAPKTWEAALPRDNARSAAPKTVFVQPGEAGLALLPSPPPWDAAYERAGGRLRLSAAALARELRLLLWPSPLVVDRDPPEAAGAPSLAELGGWALLLLWAGAALALRRRAPSAGLGLAWCLAALVPVCGLVPLYNPAAERYLYTAAAGAAWALAWAFRSAPWPPGWMRATDRGLSRGSAASRALGAAAAAALLAGFGLRTHARCSDWASDEVLFWSMPDSLASAKVRYNRGNIRLQQGRLQDAGEEYRAALRLRPGYAEAWLNLGSLYRYSGDAAAAFACYEKAAAANPRSPLPPYVHGRFLEERGETARARSRYEAALAAAPDFAPARRRLDALRGGGP